MVLAKLFGTKSDREVKKLSPTIVRINQFYESLSEKTDEDLVSRTLELKNLIINARQSKEDSLLLIDAINSSANTAANAFS